MRVETIERMPPHALKRIAELRSECFDLAEENHSLKANQRAPDCVWTQIKQRGVDVVGFTIGCDETVEVDGWEVEPFCNNCGGKVVSTESQEVGDDA